MRNFVAALSVLVLLTATALPDRSGAQTPERGDSTLILVGAITGIPRDLAWRPDDLEAAAARSNQILSPQVGQASVSDILRVIWRARTIGMMPQGQTSADYLSPDYQARLEAIMANDRNQDWRTKSLLFVGFDLMQDKAGYNRGRSADDAMDVIRRRVYEPRTGAPFASPTSSPLRSTGR
ncbi:MAG: GumN family protein [bacterium]|nr:MAG: GumN family protein [bacterium]